MKKKALLWVLALAMVLPFMAIRPVRAASYDFTGSWKFVSYDEEGTIRATDKNAVDLLTLKQEGNQVTGSSYFKGNLAGIFTQYNNPISGTLRGDKITAVMTLKNGKTQDIEIWLNPKNPSQLVFHYKDDPSDFYNQYYVRESGAGSQKKVQETSSIADFSGDWNGTLFNGEPIPKDAVDHMIFKQKGNQVTGVEKGSYKGEEIHAEISATVIGNQMKGILTTSDGTEKDIKVTLDPKDPNQFNLLITNDPNRVWTYARQDGGTQLKLPESKPKTEVVIAKPENTATPKADNPVNIPVTGGVAKNTTNVLNGITGVTVNFKPTNAIGYRVYRSEKAGALGISTTDFYITSKSFTDVNAEANTVYYYTLKEVLAEAKPLEGVSEKEGKVLATWSVKTAPDLNQGFKNPKAARHFIMLKLDDPKMTVDGMEKEVDPGRGTTPKVVRNRTILPIRAIVESMGGSAGWNQETKTVSLQANGSKVVMTIDQKDFTVNGQGKKLDVPPFVDNNRTFVPVRFSAENLNCKVDWLNSTRQIVLVWSD